MTKQESRQRTFYIERLIDIIKQLDDETLQLLYHTLTKERANETK